MTIGYAVQKGTLVYIYDLTGEPITSIAAPGRWPEDGLKGYTTTQVLIQKGTLIYAYNAKGQMVGAPTKAKAETITSIQFPRTKWHPPMIITPKSKPINKQVYATM